jgi:hypothetical protein
MKQHMSQRVNIDEGGGEEMHRAEWADVDAWLGYEFWSSQVEAEMEFWSELERAEELLSPERLARCRKESDSDVRPF